MNEGTLVRSSNERRILTLLRIQGPMTRADMARRLALTPATLTNLVEALTSRDLVVASSAARRNGGKAELGRPGVDVALNPTGAYFLGVEIGVGVIRFALLNLALNVVAQAEREVATDIGPEAVIEIVASRLKKLSRSVAGGKRMEAVVLTVPGLVRSDGFVVHLPILGWRDVNLQTLAEAALSLPVAVENNANAAAFGEVSSTPSTRVPWCSAARCGRSSSSSSRRSRRPSPPASFRGWWRRRLRPRSSADIALLTHAPIGPSSLSTRAAASSTAVASDTSAVIASTGALV